MCWPWVLDISLSILLGDPFLLNRGKFECVLYINVTALQKDIHRDELESGLGPLAKRSR